MTDAGGGVLLVGAGQMARDYARVLGALGVRPVVVGRGPATAAAFEAATGIRPGTGDLAQQLDAATALPGRAIVAVNALHLAEVSGLLIRRGFRRLLVEKPGALDRAELARLCDLAARHGAEIMLGYNRRFMASVIEAARIVAADGGVRSLRFDFSEPSRRIAALNKPQRELDTWFYGNSSHVVDLAFHFFGAPVAIQAAVTGAVSWHPNGAVFAGHARNAAGALMSWHANWLAPGRWGLEVMTAQHRLILQPLERLRVQDHAGFDEVEVALDDVDDRDFKPGLMKEVRAFLSGEGPGRMQGLRDHAANFDYYEVIRRGGRLG